jgi:purine-nucleoside phosphorylase
LVRDVVLAQGATTVATPSSTIFREIKFAPLADFGLLVAAHRAATARGARVHVGNIYSSDTFYTERFDHTESLTRHGVLAVEMEAAELYILAARYGVRALAVLTISDHIVTGEELDSHQRQESFGDMIEIALEAAFA